MFFDEDLDEDAIAEYLATAGAIEREEYLEGLNLLKSRLFGGNQVGRTQVGGGEDNIIEYYSKIKSSTDSDSNKQMIEMVLDFANSKLISLDPKPETRVVEIGSPTPTPTKASNNIAPSKRQQALEALKQIKTKSKDEYTIGETEGKSASAKLLELVKVADPVAAAVAAPVAAPVAAAAAEPVAVAAVDQTQHKTQLTEIETKLTELKVGPNAKITVQSFDDMFQFIPIPGDGNCLFNAIAWWILQYNANDPVTFSDAGFIQKKYNAPPTYNDIYTLAPSLRTLVCGFYVGFLDKYPEIETIYNGAAEVIDKTKFKEITTRLESTQENKILRDLFINYQIQLTMSGDNPLDHCVPTEYSGLAEAIVLVHILKFNLNVLNFSHSLVGDEVYLQSFYCGVKARPTMIIFRRGAHWDVFYPKTDGMKPLIAPLNTNISTITTLAAESTAGHEEYKNSKSEPSLTAEQIAEILSNT